MINLITEVKKLEKYIPAKKIIEEHKNDDYLIWLDSSLEDKTLGRFSIIGINPLMKIEINNQKLKLSDTHNILSLEVKKKLKSYKTNEALKIILDNINIKNDPKINIPFKFGLLGYFSYEYLDKFKKKSELKTPDSFWFLPQSVFVFDHIKKQTYNCNIKIKNNISETKYKDKKKKMEIKYELKFKDYLKKIKYLKKKIYDGEIYETCLTHKIKINNINNPLSLYLKLRENNKAPFSAFLRIKNINILCNSPERFLRLENKTAEMRPIKGTIKRGKNSKEDKKLEEKLKSSIKNQAENIMIVDLIRNDLGKVCKFGSVKVIDLFKIEKYTSLFQMVSTIKGELQGNKDIFDLIDASFPGGSMTGAPKKRAMKYIEKLEKKKRGIYSGTIGYIDSCGNADLNIVIRTIIHDEKTKKAYLQVGGAIVQDSKNKEEYEESMLKAKKILEICKTEYLEEKII